jgi:hypothetical protein
MTQITEIPTVTAREHAARVEIDRLRAEIHALVSASDLSDRATIDEAVMVTARLQVVTANLDACGSHHARDGRGLVGMADRRLQRHDDAIERGMAYTADATMRRLLGEV